MIKQAAKARSRQNHKKSGGLAALTRAFFCDFNADIALNVQFNRRKNS